MTSAQIPASLDLERAALFLDFDGTLAPIAPRPDQVVVAESTLDALARLTQALDGAVAIISGRDLDDIDAHLAPLALPAAGSHGAERRDAGGRLHRNSSGAAALAAAERGLRPAAERLDLLLEKKRGAVSLHFRARPELEAECRALADQLAAATPGLRVIHGHMVTELALADRNKGLAVEAFLAEAPFEGRLPIAIGDDATDEDAFRAAQRHGGLGVKIGPGETIAQARAPDIAAFLDWLGAAAARLSNNSR